MNSESIFIKDTTPQIFTEEMKIIIKKSIINNIRNKRNKLLNDSDKYFITDFPITSENLILIKEYRQNLRDYFELSKVISYINNTNDILPELPLFPIFNK